MAKSLRKILLAFCLIIVLACATVAVTLFARTATVVESTTAGNAQTTSFSLDIPEGGYKYDGSKHEPEVIGDVYYGGKKLVKDVDYDIVYENQTNAGEGTAAVVIKLKGDYSGEYRIFYDIEPSDATDITTSVSWEVLSDDGEWKACEVDEISFTFDESDQNTKIRAKLTYVNNTDGQTVGDPQTVYVKGYVAEDDDKQNTSMYLTFAEDTDTTEFKYPGTYKIQIHGNPNYQYKDGNNTISVEMKKQAILIGGEMLSADTFKNYIDESGTRLWSLLIKNGEKITTATLLDNLTYIDPDGKLQNSGIKLTEGTLTDAYARYCGEDTSLALGLNDNYKFADGTALGKVLEHGEIITQTQWHEGELNEVVMFTTTVKIKFDSNYAVDTGSEYDTDNVITITKTWYIVNMSNDLRNADDSSTISSLALSDWTFGVWDNGAPNSVQATVFRPEHGNTVFYSYYLEGSDAEPARVAIVYSSESSNASRSFYSVVKGADRRLVTKERISTESGYLYTFNYENLGAGTYNLEIYVPQPEASDDSHIHWYEGDETADDYGVFYREFTYNFTFTVNPYVIGSDYASDEHLKIEWPVDNSVEYTGEDNNYVHPTLILCDRMVLVEGVDYTLSSPTVNVGQAELVVTGLGNIVCDFRIEDAYLIRQAGNSWIDVPSIASWTYNSFNRQINLLSGEPNFGKESLWFAIAYDEDGTDIVDGLGNIVLGDDGYVSTDIATILKGLHAGYYYLCAHVADDANYTALDPQPVQFRIFQAPNSWAVTPTVNAWITGRYDDVELDGNGIEIQRIVVTPIFGTAHVLIVDDNGKVYYDSDNDINILNKAKPGRYTLTAYVDGTDDYSALDTYTIVFNVFKKPGLPWWATLLVALGSLGLAALVIFILWKNGIYRLIRDKIVVAIRTRVSVESTIASVRAAKMMEEGKKSVEAAKRRERLEQLREKQRSMTPEERAAQLEAKAQASEAKAQAEVERAEKLRARKDAEIAKAEKMRQEQEAASNKRDEVAASDDNPEPPTEQ